MTENNAGVDLVNDARLPLARRVGVQLSALLAILDSYDDIAPAAGAIKLENVPGLAQISAAGVGSFLK
jgi:hypothetical protein